MSTEQDTFPVSAAEMKKKNMFYHSITDMMAIVHQRLRGNFDFNSGCDIIALPTKVVVTCKNVYETKHCLTSIIQNVNINGVIYWPRQLFYDDKLGRVGLFGIFCKSSEYLNRKLNRLLWSENIQ